MTLYYCILGLHIIAGFTALTSGTINIIAKKGRQLHQATGNFFFWGMLAVSISAIALCALKFNAFLLHIALFTLYMNVAGKMSVVEKSLCPKWWEIVLLLVALTNGAWMLASLDPILMTFGGISVALGINDCKNNCRLYKQQPLKKNAWLRRHIGHMLGTYLSTFTAFLVMNVQVPSYDTLVWLAPTIIISPLILYWTIKVGRPKFKMSFVATLLFVTVSLVESEAQVYTEKQTRHRFAQLNLGLDVQSSFGGQTTILDRSGEAKLTDLPSVTRPRFIIGGTHFWGHADFYVAIPITYPRPSSDDYDFSFGSSVETVFKYYPWRIEDGKICPYIGTGLASYYFSQNSLFNDELANGADLNMARYPIYAGVTFNKGNHLFEANFTYNYANGEDYFINPTQEVGIEFPPLFASLTYKYMIETTIGAEKEWESGRTQKITDTVGEQGRLNDFFVGIAPSSSTMVRRSEYNKKERPFFGTPGSGINWDVTAGYHFHNLDMNIAVNWRRLKGVNRAFQIEQFDTRNSFGLEVTKNLGDYHGFVPFIGPCLTYEQLNFREFVNGDLLIDQSENKPALGVTFGWDILPNRLQSFVLRTNLRYFPNLKLDLQDGETFYYDNIEFNFIQLVVYPERIFKGI
ncbi:MAG: hypothetical protein AAGI23_07390 [Bacteroidota bacterium]